MTAPMAGTATSRPARRWLTFSLRTFLVVTLALSLVMGYVGRVWLRILHDRTPPTLSEMARIAVRHGIPMPAKEAKLVLAHRGTVNGRVTYSPAFLLAEKADGSIVVLRGATEETLKPRDSGDPLWREFSFASSSSHTADFDYLAALVSAIQLADRSEEQRAKELFERFTQAKDWGDCHGFYDREHELLNLRQLVGRCAYDHQERRLRDAANWPDVRVRLEALFDEFPGLQQDRFQEDERRALLRDLATTLDAPPPRPGSVEALLLDWSQRPDGGQWGGIVHDPLGNDADEPARQIVLRGFDAVPELISLCDDSRITAHWQASSLSARHYMPRTGELAHHLLQAISGRDNHFFTEDVTELESDPMTMADWEAWWAEARPIGERAYFIDALFDWQRGRIVEIREGPGRILAEKYPEELPALCARFCQLATTDTQSFALAEALVTAKMPQAERNALLAKFAQGGSLTHQRCALQVLAKVDQQKCAELTLTAVQNFVRTPDVLGYSDSPEASFAHVVMQIDDVRVWRAYLRAARRSDSGLRMEMMNPMNYTYVGERNRALRLAFLASFLDDEAVRASVDGSFAAFSLPQIAVRDFVAIKLGGILGILKVHPPDSWKPKQWSELRAQVREALAQEELPQLE
jgi:hypothetical protein